MTEKPTALPPHENPPPKKAGVHVVWGLVIVALAAIAVFAYKTTLDTGTATGFRLIDETKDAARAAAAAAERVAEKFKTGTITETFRAEIPVFKSAGVGLLEVGTIDSTETFRRSDVKRIGWNAINLGETVTEISVPVTYRYHLDLGGDWQISVADGECIVKAPLLEPSLPVAIHTNRMRKSSTNGWLRFNADNQVEILQRSITPKLNAIAEDSRQIDSIREEARLVVARFIRAWLIREDQWTEGKFTRISVHFPDDPADQPLEIPTITIGDETALIGPPASAAALDAVAIPLPDRVK